jgi:hypothetical protein
MALGLTQTNRNEYQKYFLGGKGSLGWQTYNLHVPRVLKSGSLNPGTLRFLKSESLKLLEPSDSVQACNGIALSLPSLFLL